jgi:hypothetical protein
LVAERIDIRGTAFLRFECDCGQKQQSPEKDGKAKCARCGTVHEAES